MRNLFEDFADPEYVLLVAFVASMGTLFLLQRLKRWRRHQYDQPIAMALLLLGTLLISLPKGARWQRWQSVLAMLPSYLVVYQAFFVWLNEPRPLGIEREAKDAETVRNYEEVADSNRQREFGQLTLLTRYYVPALLLGIAGIVFLKVVTDPATFISLIKSLKDAPISDPDAEKIVRGLKLGLVGAYTYILLELGRRTFQHDITGGIAMWCLVTLVLGPVLAASVAVLWQIDPPRTHGWWGAGVVLFFTGFAPRRVMAAIEQAAMQLLKIGSSTGVVQTRLIPLTNIRGIGPEIEERLREEGIVDANSLAAAEPFRLVRNTSFEITEILSWIDEAILVVTLPRSWQALEDEGITGAIDLTWYKSKFPSSEDVPERIKKLAEKCKLDAASLADVIRRLSEDPQLLYIKACFTRYAAGTGSGKP